MEYILNKEKEDYRINSIKSSIDVLSNISLPNDISLVKIEIDDILNSLIRAIEGGNELTIGIVMGQALEKLKIINNKLNCSITYFVHTDGDFYLLANESKKKILKFMSLKLCINSEF